METRMLKDAIKEWLDVYKRKSVKEATYRQMNSVLNTLSSYPTAKVPVNKLQRIDIQYLINTLADDGYSYSMIRAVIGLITMYLKSIDSLIFVGIEFPRVTSLKQQPKTIEAYTPIEQKKLVDILSRGDYKSWAAGIIMLETGMRIGEVLALEWDDILWNKRAIRIRKTLIKTVNGSRVQNEPKTKSSKRTIPMSSKVIDTLSTIEHQGQYIFESSKRGKPIAEEVVRAQMIRACDEAGVPFKGLHIFRHTFATNCYARGCEVKLLSKMLGHSNVAITYNTYIHLYGDALEEMRSIVDLM